MRVFGIIGWPLGFSLSKDFFEAKFAAEGLSDECRYELFPLERISDLGRVLDNNPDLAGFNVTIPYKKAVLRFLDEMSPEARETGAVNCVKVIGDGGRRLAGYNTDAHGFRVGLEKLLGLEKLFGQADIAGLRPEAASGSRMANSKRLLKALVLGTGGASQAVQWVLGNAGIEYTLVSREGAFGRAGGMGTSGGAGTSAYAGRLSYEEVTPEIIEDHRLIVNTTPLGMYPAVEGKPALPYQAIGTGHYLYDLVYNPRETAFLKEGARRGAATIGGETMLYAQAERNWEIWNTGE